jgi:hypothetical protein
MEFYVGILRQGNVYPVLEEMCNYTGKTKSISFKVKCVVTLKRH